MLLGSQIPITKAVLNIQCRAIKTIALEMNRLNSEMSVGGDKMACEADEIALGCVPGVNEDGEPGVWWLRYIGLMKRGSTRIWLEPLPDRFVKNAGQGGGGSLSIEELIEAFRRGTLNPVLVPGGLLHMDNAKAYNRTCLMR